MGRIRGYINKKFIENNPSLIEAMVNINKIQGRRRTVFGRACLVLQLYVKYSILRYDKFDERQKKINRASYPESFVNQKTEIQKIRSKLKENSDVTFDMLGVVFYEALDLHQLLALVESKEHYIGLSEVQNIRYTLSPEQLLQLEGIVADFMLENPFIHSLIEEMCCQGKNVYIYNNSDYADELVQKILDGHQYNII